MAQSITDPTVTSPDPTKDPTLNQPLLGASVPGGADDVGSQIDALYKKAGLTDAGAGGGFADRAYWLAHPSEVLNGRLGRDLEGTGTDQPTGTPGRGAWLNSGRDAPEASIGQPTRNANGGFWTTPIAPPTPVPPAAPSGTTPTTRPTTYPTGSVADLYWAGTNGQYTPTAQDLAQFGASPDRTYLDKIGPAIQQWWGQNKDALLRRQALTAAVTPPAGGTTTPTTGTSTTPTGSPSMSGPVPLKANGKVDTDALNRMYPSMSPAQVQAVTAYLLAHPELQGEPGSASPGSPSGAGTIPDTMGGVPNP